MEIDLRRSPSFVSRRLFAGCVSRSPRASVEEAGSNEPRPTLHDPQGEDGYCPPLDRANPQCGVYEDRPFVCRAYDCRKDKRIWEDFEKRTINPELENLIAKLKSNLRYENEPEDEVIG